MLGNFVTALAILGPAGMLSDLAAGLLVSIRDAGLLVTFGAVVLCIGSPLMAWATSGFERRGLLAATLAVLAVGHMASAFAPDYAALLVLRVVMLSIGAIYTPIAASTIALIVPLERRASAIALVFLGWSLAIAGGLPLVALSAEHLGWRATYGALGILAALACLLHLVGIPAGLKGVALSLSSWGAVARNRFVVVLLTITMLWTCGQFVLFPYLGPLIKTLAGGGTQAIGAVFAAMGIMGVIGNVSATHVVMRLGPFNTSMVFMTAMFLGTFVWAVGAGVLIVMGVGVALWGFGFAALNSMQQARLVAAAPEFASATVALNTSANYVGQGIGSALGAQMYAQGLLVQMGFAATALMLAALAVLATTRGGARPAP
jgi:MFS transporter, DHA1 family, inner membrane transport protein